ncbi:MAG: lysine--tRNA ligase [Candidatus Moraniibacteriota bacterium]|jgi:lysyl-tRNA synthetase, class II
MSEQGNTKISEFEERKSKLDRLKEHEIVAYPASSDRTYVVGDILNDFGKLEKDETIVTVCGRLRSKRVHGNLSFADIEDESGRMQVAVSKKEVGDNYKPFAKLIDASDFVQITGKVFTTKAGQQTIMATEWKLLTKALRGMPVEHFGLKDEDEKFRKRYVDMVLNPELRDMFKRRAKFWRVMRNFMEERDFFEVETPSIEVTTGGAEARPFATHHNDFDMPVFMRISIGELWQKRLMASGFEKTFEIGRAYRNEGSSPNHVQEFTNMEFYWAYADYKKGMKMVTELYRYIAQEVYGTTKFIARGLEFDLADEWIEIDYVTEVEKQTGINVITATNEELGDKLNELEVKYAGDNRERRTDALWKYCRKNIAGPAFLVNHPVFMAPLAKRKADKPEQSEKFQVLLGGAEVGAGYSELNDPIDQRVRFEAQEKMLKAGDDEAMMPDWEFVEMLEYGMPPTCGFGVGERLFAFLEDKTLREVTLFPLMKPKNNENVEESINNIDLGINLEQANKLIDEYVTTLPTKVHSEDTESIMRELAKHFGEDEEKWGIVGLLHDLDRDETRSALEKHTIIASEYLEKAGASDFLIETIKSHCYGNGKVEELNDKERTIRLQHALMAADMLSGLISATVMVSDSKDINKLKLKSLKKKFKSKTFAERYSREKILECEKIGLSLDEFLEMGLTSLQNIKD